MMLTAHDKIEKPRDKEKFLAMISKSKRDMLNVAKKLSTLKMELDKEDEPMVKKVVDMLKKASNAHAGQAKDLEKAIKESLNTIVQKQILYHKTFSDAMQHAYDYAKKKLGVTVDPKEIDNKVATGPKKPSEGKTNIYRLKGKGGNLQIQVYNKGGRKPFELTMYKEENEMTKSLKDTIVEMWSEAVSPAQQAAIAIIKKEKEEKDGKMDFRSMLSKAKNLVKVKKRKNKTKLADVQEDESTFVDGKNSTFINSTFDNSAPLVKQQSSVVENSHNNFSNPASQKNSVSEEECQNELAKESLELEHHYSMAERVSFSNWINEQLKTDKQKKKYKKETKEKYMYCT
jgi:hypothetical protein